MPRNQALKIAIAAKGIRQYDVARRARIDYWRLSRIIANIQTPTPEELIRLARVLGTTAADLQAGVSS